MGSASSYVTFLQFHSSLDLCERRKSVDDEKLLPFVDSSSPKHHAVIVDCLCREDAGRSNFIYHLTRFIEHKCKDILVISHR